MLPPPRGEAPARLSGQWLGFGTGVRLATTRGAAHCAGAGPARGGRRESEVRGAAVRSTRELSVWPAGHRHSREKLSTEAVPAPRCRLSGWCLSGQLRLVIKGVRLHRAVDEQRDLTGGSERKQNPSADICLIPGYL